MDKPFFKVVAAVIEKKGAFLLARRPKGSHKGGFWEFPGGKIDPLETAEQALVRELKEEIGIEVRPGRLLQTIRHSYPDREIELEFYEAHIADGDPRLIEPSAIGWFEPVEMPALPILPADLEFVARLENAGPPRTEAPAGDPLMAPADFSWSASRHGLFEDCRRAYFFHYYLSLGRALEADPARKRLAWRLRQLTSLPLWIGSRVHDTVEAMLKTAIQGTVPDTEQAVEGMVTRMRHDFKESRQGLQLTAPNPKDVTRFFEHEYEQPVEDTQWQSRVEEAKTMVRAFAAGPYLELAGALARRPHDLLSIENLDTWSFETVPVYARIDFAYRDPDGLVHILDWKTGRQERGENPLQMMGYAAMAAQRWNTPEERLRVREIYLRLGPKERPCSITPDSMELARTTIRASIRCMVDCLADPGGNRGREEDFPLTDSLRVCEGCFFRRICPRFGSP